MLMNDKIMFDRYHCINKLYVTLRSQLPGKPVSDGLQERPGLGPLGLCVRGVCIRSRFFKMSCMYVCILKCLFVMLSYMYVYCIFMPLLYV